MRIMAFLLFVLCLYISGCAPTQLPRSDIPAWDEGISLDSDDTEPPSLSDRLRDTFVGNSNYHFRKVRWGFSRERVEFKDGVYTHVDPAFFNELHEMNFPALELSFYDKQLMGVLLKGRRLRIHGIGTIPQ